METLRMGNALDKGIDIGAIVDNGQLKTIKKMVKIGVEEGSALSQPSWSCPKEGVLLSSNIVYRCISFRDPCSGRNIWSCFGSYDL